MYNNIVNVNFNEILVRTKNFIRLTLHIKWKIFVIYKSDTKFLLITIINNNKFKLIVLTNVELIKLIYDIYNENI